MAASRVQKSRVSRISGTVQRVARFLSVLRPQGVSGLDTGLGTEIAEEDRPGTYGGEDEGRIFGASVAYCLIVAAAVGEGWESQG
jgi:hypothetical protein